MSADETTNRPVVVGHLARAELCDCGGCVVFSLGPVSFRLEVAVVDDVVSTLQRMLALLEQTDGGQPTRPSTCKGDRGEDAPSTESLAEKSLTRQN